MTRFSASDAALEGFSVLRRHWRVVVGWAGFNLVALVAMIVVAVTAMVLSVGAVGIGGGGEGAAQSAGGIAGGAVGLIGALCIAASVVTALFRLMLTDQAPGFFYLRLGWPELRMLGVWVAVVTVGAAVAFGVVGVAAASAKLGAWVVVAVGLAGGALGVWLTTRLCLLAPATFAEQRLAVSSAWRLSRGRFWPLLGMNALALCLLLMTALAAWLMLFVLMAAISGFRDYGVLSLSDKDAFTDHPARYLIQLAAQLVFTPVLWVIAQAPLASAYQAFTRTAGPWDEA